jgi:hypothetical protein
LAPIWDEFAEKNSQTLNVGRVDCADSDNSGICSAYEIEGYPTLILIKEGMFYKYRGERSVEALEKFALDGGYKKAHQFDEIPRKVEGFELYMKSFNRFLNQLAMSIGMMFDKIGLGDIPRNV